MKNEGIPPKNTAIDRIREIPYNYTSFSDKEIVTRLLGVESWNILCNLRNQRRTGRSSRMLYEVLGDIWAVERNPYLQDDLLNNRRRRLLLIDALKHRLQETEKRRDPSQPERDALVGKLLDKAREAVAKFESSFSKIEKLRHRALRLIKKYTH